MDKEQWLKAIECSKEELIKWLNEMYEDEQRTREIIRKYEELYGVQKENIQEQIENPKTLRPDIRFYTKVKARNFNNATGFEYTRNWS